MKNLKLTALFGKVYAWTLVDGRWSLHRVPDDDPILPYMEAMVELQESVR